MYKIILLFIFFYTSLFAQNINLAKPVEFTPKNLSFFEDKDSKLSFKEIQKKEFIPTDSIVYFGYSSSTYWLKFTYEMNQEMLNENNKYILALKKPYIEHINLYYIQDGIVHQKHNGRHYSLHDKEYPYKEAVFYLPSAQNQTIYIKLCSKDVIMFNANISNEHQFLKKEINYHLFMGIYFGFLIVMIFYNLSLYAKLKDPDYFWYTSFLIAICITTSSNFHYFDAYIYEPNEWLGNRMYILSYIASTVLIQKMAQSLLKTKIYALKLHKLLNFSMILATIPLIHTILSHKPTILVAIAYSLIPLVFVNITAIRVMYKNSRLAKYFSIAFFIFSFGVATIPLVFFGLIQNSFLALHGYMFGTMVEVTILSLALSDKITQIQEENIQIQDKLLQISKSENSRLEKMVSQRTLQLDSLVKDKELLLREVYHRVTNNFQMVISILWLEGNRFQDKEKKSSYLSLINRIKSMSLVHQFLYDSNTLSQIKATEYIQNIIDEIKKVYSQKDVLIETQVDEHFLEMESAMALGMIINEVINNSIKYHPDNYQCKINLSFLVQKKKQKIILIINDNGIGITQEQRNQSTGLGMNLIKQFTSKLSNALTSFSAKAGTQFTLSYNFD